MTWATPERRVRFAWQLLLASGLAVFAERALGRWLAAEVTVLAAVPHLPLMASLLGLGLGCARGRDCRRLFPWFPGVFGLLCLLVAYGEPLGLARLRLPVQPTFLWSSGRVLPGVEVAKGFGVLAGFAALTVLAFAALGEKIGELFDAFPALTAYTVSVSASLLAVLVFSAVTFLRWPPLLWVAVAAGVGLWLFRRPLPLVVLAVTVALVAAAPSAGRWSPYGRIDFEPLLLPEQDGVGALVQVGYVLDVNRDSRLRALDLSDGFRDKHQGIFRQPAYRHANLVHNLPFRLATATGRVLLVGAGLGNDVAAALRRGATRVDAVEIDPTILELEQRFHPEEPYAGGRVRAVVADGRTFLRWGETRYDLIVFASPAAYPLTSWLSPLRPGYSLYTVEGLREALGRLAPRGVLALSFDAGAGEEVGERLVQTIREAWGREPLALHNGQDAGVVVLAGPGLDVAAASHLAGLLPWSPRFPGGQRIRSATDDWPVFSASPPEQPLARLVVMALLLVVAGLLVAVTSRRRAPGYDWHMFLLGAAFVLVGGKSLTALSLLFGSTWAVDSAVIAGILLTILAANGTVVHYPGIGPAAGYGCLAGSLLVSYLAGMGWLATWPFPWQAIVGGLAAWLPIFFAGLVFARSFRRTRDASGALAANMFGALAGTVVLEYAWLSMGLGSLTLLALALYGFSWLTLAFRGWRLSLAGGGA
jgi:SAM-dependent methyltransferase